MEDEVIVAVNAVGSAESDKLDKEFMDEYNTNGTKKIFYNTIIEYVIGIEKKSEFIGIFNNKAIAERMALEKFKEKRILFGERLKDTKIIYQAQYSVVLISDRREEEVTFE